MKVCNLQITLEKAVTDEEFVKAEEIKQEVTKLREELKNKEDELKGPVVLDTQDEALVCCDFPTNAFNLFLQLVGASNDNRSQHSVQMPCHFVRAAER